MQQIKYPRAAGAATKENIGGRALISTRPDPARARPRFGLHVLMMPSRPDHPAPPLDDQSDDDRFRLLVDAVVDYAIYMLDPSGHVVSWNAGAQRFKGYSATEIIGQHFSRFYTPEDIDAGVPAFALRTAATLGKFETEGWRVRKDGTRFWAHVVIDPIKDSTGGLLGFAKVTRDLTERKLADQELQASQVEFRLLVQSVTDYAIYMLDPSGKVASWNAGAQRIKGYLPEEIIGNHFSRFYTDEDRRDGAPERALKTAEREGRFEKEGWRVRKDGSRFWANVVIDPIRGPDGSVRGFAKITRDITERRESQQKLDQAREALLQSQKMDAIGQLTGGVAHDFNNLLTAILGSLELVRKRPGIDARAALLIDNAMQAARRGANLTQRMLAFARRQDLKPELVDIPVLVNGMMDLLERTLGSGTSIVSRFPADMGAVRVDPTQLEMAVLNLAVNARDAMPNGGPITISAEEQALAEGNAIGLKAGRYTMMSVADRGGGMDADTLKRATEPFFTTKGIGKGTGLGLPMVHGLAEQSGGRFVLASTVGKGTTATLWLPVDTSGAPAAARAEDAASAMEESASLAILAVDDDALVLVYTVAMLEEAGHRVTSAYSGVDALKEIESSTFDLVITDQRMPGMTGAELVEKIRERWPTLPVLVATGYAELPSDLMRGVQRVAKPFTQRQLLDAVAAATKKPDRR
jgi:PAS domain S-box-containing protein